MSADVVCMGIHAWVMHVARTSWGIGANSLMKCDECGEIDNETIHCWECGGDYCCASCWPKHDKECE